MSSTNIRILHLEDDSTDAELQDELLRAEGFDVESARVDIREEFIAALEAGGFDLILADHAMPGFDGLTALKIAREKVPGMPFIFVSGTLGEEIAIESLKNGATDYVIKQRLQRLAPVIRRALDEAENRRAQERAEEALRRSEERYRILSEAARDLITIVDRNWTVTFTNMFAAQQFGVLPQDLVGKKVGEIFPAEVANRQQDNLQKVLDSGSPLYVEAPAVFPGKTVWLGTWLVPVRDRSGVEWDSILIVSRDITERKQTEEKLHDSEKRFRALIENAPDGIVLFDGEGKILFESPSVTRLLGFATEERVGQHVFEYMHPEDHPRMIELFSELLGTPDMSAYAQLRYLHKDGSWRWVEGTGNNLLAEPSIQAFIVNYRDITERKRAEDALTRSEEKYRRLTENAVDIVFRYDLLPEMKLTYINPIVETISGYTREECMADQYLMLNMIHPDDLPRMAEYVTQRSVPIEPLSMRWIAKDGSVHWMESRIVQVHDEGGRLVAVEGITRDVTEQRQAEQALRESEIRYRLATRATNDVIWEWNSKTHELVWSENAESAFGYLPGEIGPDETWWDAHIHPEDRERVLARLDDLVAGKESIWLEEYRLLLKDGSYAYISDHAYVERDPAGGAIRMIGAMSNITARKRAEEQMLRRMNELEALHQSGIAFSQTLDQRDIGEKVIEVLSGRLDWHHAAVRVRRGDSDEVELIASIHPGEQRDGGVRLKKAVSHLGEGLAGWVIQHGTPLRISNLAEDPRYVETFDGMNSGLYVPMRIHNTIIGCISAESDQADAFTEEDTRLLMTLATQAAVAIQNARLFEAMQNELSRRTQAEARNRQQLARLTALREIDQAINSSFDLDISLNVLLSQTVKLLGVDAATVLKLDPGTNMLRYVAGLGFRTNVVKTASITLTESYAGQAALERHVVELPDLTMAAENLLLTGFLQGEGFVSYYGAPLIGKGKVMGVLEVFHRSVVERDEEWLDFFNTLAGQAAIAMDNGQLFQDLHRTNNELMQAYDATIEGWSRAMDLRDKETEGHTLRVTQMALDLARSLGIQEDALVHIRRGALLHDIGKMGVPDHILLKPAELTTDEWQIMRQHPAFAYEMLSPIRYLQAAAIDIPYCHHERWDGSGYPRGLKGEQIPLAARIFAVVDVWDAVTSDRPYRAAWSKERALEYIQEQAGKHFDPGIVEAFLRLISGS